MDSVQLQSNFSHMVDDFFENGPNVEELVALTTLASKSLTPLEGGILCHFERSSTSLLQSNLRQDEDLIKQSTTTVLSGWRLGAWTAGCFAIASLIVNLAAVAYLAAHRQAQTPSSEIYKGDCSKVRSLGLWIHLLINLISTLLLGGSNYCMQCLCSPSRAELDRAHAKGVSLDIGVPSPSNQFAVSKLKRVLWWILVFSSIPLHLMYNSAFYTSIGVRDYAYYVVKPEFLTGQVTYNNMGHITTVYHDYIGSHGYQNLTNLECIKAYAKPISVEWSTLLLVTSKSSSNYSVIAGSVYLQAESLDGYGGTFEWICRGDSGFESTDTSCVNYVTIVESHADQWIVLNESVDYCLARPAKQQCAFHGNFFIMVVVLVCNFAKGIVMIYVAVQLPGRPLITIGDAIQSFIEKPDPTTKGMCWVTRRHIQDYTTYAYHFPHAPWPANTVNAKTEARSLSLHNMRWFNAPGYAMWIGSVLLFSLALAALSALFCYGYSWTFFHNPYSSITKLGFGALQSTTIINGMALPQAPTAQVLASALIANSPQVIFSCLYLSLNRLMTSMWLADEWHRFATQRKYLRVSSPKGKQRSTHFLQLPYKISIPLMMLSGVLHWTLSQSLFLVVVSEYDIEGKLSNPLLVASCGFSLLPMVATIVLGFITILLTLGLGFRRYDGRIPLVGSCSAAISAACHRPSWDRDAALRPLQYGQPHSREPRSDVRHCCFTSGVVEFVKEGKKYA